MYRAVCRVCSRIFGPCMLWLILFFFTDTATTEIYTYRHTLSLHDALPISLSAPLCVGEGAMTAPGHDRRHRRTYRSRQDPAGARADRRRDRKSTRLNSSH